MSNRPKRFAVVALGVVLIYVLTPFVAGLVGTYDRRGPKIFARSPRVALQHRVFFVP